MLASVRVWVLFSSCPFLSLLCNLFGRFLFVCVLMDFVPVHFFYFCFTPVFVFCYLLHYSVPASTPGCNKLLLTLRICSPVWVMVSFIAVSITVWCCFGTFHLLLDCHVCFFHFWPFMDYLVDTVFFLSSFGLLALLTSCNYVNRDRGIYFTWTVWGITFNFSDGLQRECTLCHHVGQKVANFTLLKLPSAYLFEIPFISNWIRNLLSCAYIPCDAAYHTDLKWFRIKKINPIVW